MKISVIIRSFNDIGTIEKTMTALRRQQLPPGWELELVNIDNQSCDGTMNVIRRLNPDGVVLEWPSGEYMPGAVLNHAVAHATGDMIVFNNSDAIPLGDDYLRTLVTPLAENEADVVFARQEPRSNARYLVRKDHERAFGDGKIAAGWKHFFSLASAAASRELCVKYKFRKNMTYSEDIEWSWRLRRKQYRIRYVAEAGVEHSHNYTLRQTARRFYNEGVADYMIFQGKLSWWRSFLLPLLRELLRDICYLASHNAPLTAYRELWYRFVQRNSFYRGRRNGPECGWWR